MDLPGKYDVVILIAIGIISCIFRELGTSNILSSPALVLPTSRSNSNIAGIMSTSGSSITSATPRSAGIRLSVQKFRFHNHELLLRLLSHLLRSTPTLLGSDVSKYLKAAGVDVDGITNGLQSGGTLSHRSVGSTMASNGSSDPSSIVIASSISAFYTPVRNRALVNTHSTESFQSVTTETTNPSTLHEIPISALSPIIGTPMESEA